MYPSCENLTQTDLSICGLQNDNDTEVDTPIFDEDLEKIVSMTVFVLFGFIFVAGLIGNALVVIVGESSTNQADTNKTFSCSSLFCSCFQSIDAIYDQYSYY
jgi:hypothetical protein